MPPVAPHCATPLLRAPISALGRCNSCIYHSGDGVCEVDYRLASNPDTRFEIEVDVDDDSGLSTRLMTGPNFGCVLHVAA